MSTASSRQAAEHQAVAIAEGADAPADELETTQAEELETVEADDVVLELLPEPDPIEHETAVYDVEATYTEEEPPTLEPEPFSAAAIDEEFDQQGAPIAAPEPAAQAETQAMPYMEAEPVIEIGRSSSSSSRRSTRAGSRTCRRSARASACACPRTGWTSCRATGHRRPADLGGDRDAGGPEPAGAPPAVRAARAAGGTHPARRRELRRSRYLLGRATRPSRAADPALRAALSPPARAPAAHA